MRSVAIAFTDENDVLQSAAHTPGRKPPGDQDHARGGECYGQEYANTWNE
jgi:hypothetical protein